MSQLNPEIKAKWAAALRSGVYQQIIGSLANRTNGRCCLGVLCDLAVEAGIARTLPVPGRSYISYVSVTDPSDHDSGLLPSAVVRWAGLDRSNPIIRGLHENLSGLNDHGLSFTDIANHIEREL